MKIPKVWYTLCVLFCTYSLSILIGEQYRLTYLSESIENRTHLLGCRKLKDFYPNETTINLDRLRDHLYRHLLRQSSNAAQNRSKFFHSIGKLVLNQTRPSDLRIWNNFVCCAVSTDFDSPRAIHLWALLRPDEPKFVFDANTFDFSATYLNEPSQLVVLNRGWPYTNCYQRNSRFYCLNECFKRRFRLSRYYYDGGETGLIQLTYGRNRSIEKSEAKCFKQCKRENCRITNFLSNSYSSKIKAEAFKAYPMVGAFDYCTQLLGLVCLFSNISLLKLLLISFRSIDFKVKKDRTSRRCLVYLKLIKLITLSVTMVAFSSLLARMVLDYQYRRDNPVRKMAITNLIRPNATINLVLCVPVYSNSRNKLPFYLPNVHYNLSLSELEKGTADALDRVLKKISLNYQNKTTQIHYVLQNKVLFLFHSSSFSRCFQICAHPVEPVYQSLLSISKLQIKFRIPSHKIRSFLLTDHETFNQKSFRHKREETFRKRIIESQKARCIDYRVSYAHLNCTSRWSCVDSCVSRRLLNQYHNITIKPASLQTKGNLIIVDKDRFSSVEWETCRVYLGKKDGKDILVDVLKKCQREVANEKACVEINFEYSAGIEQPDEKIEEIDMYYEVIRSTEELPSWYKLLLDMLNLQSIFFGLTAFELLRMISVMLKMRRNKTSLLLISCICSAGFAYQIYHVFDAIINRHLTQSQYYKLLKDTEMPLVVFCFSYNVSSIDKNHKLTGNYLQKLTQEIGAPMIFNRIAYLNELNEWSELKRESIDFFFFVDKKCFTIRTEVSKYQRDQFYFSGDKVVLKVNFSESVRLTERVTHFMTKARDAMQFSKIVGLKFRESYFFQKYSFHVDKRYKISQESFVVIYEDKFNFIKFLIKSPLSAFRGQVDLNDVRSYFSSLLRGYQNTLHLVTLNMPIRRSLFNYPIDDDLFAEYNSQIQNKSDREKPANLNYRRQFAMVNIDQLSSGESDISFHLEYFMKVVEYTNDESYAKLILSIFNALSVWFSLGVLDLHAFVFKPKCLFVRAHKLLVSSRSVLCRSMDSVSPDITGDLPRLP